MTVREKIQLEGIWALYQHGIYAVLGEPKAVMLRKSIEVPGALLLDITDLDGHILNVQFEEPVYIILIPLLPCRNFSLASIHSWTGDRRLSKVGMESYWNGDRAIVHRIESISFT